MRLDCYVGSLPHFAAHCLPVWRALPDDIKGGFYARGRAETYAKGFGDIEIVGAIPRRAELVLVASFEDHRAVKTQTILVNHGCGMRYKDESGDYLPHPSYSGGNGRENVALFICPSERDAEVCRQSGVPAHACGVPYLDPYHSGKWTRSQEYGDDPRPIVALTWHADVHVVPETRWAYPHYADAVKELAQRQDELPFQLVGHCHPRMFAHMHGIYRRLGIRFEPNWFRIMGQASLLCVDNSSVMFEAASIGMPVLTLSAPWYRRNVHHGLRFWDAIPGLHVEHPSDLYDGILAALSDPVEAKYEREKAVRMVYEDLCDGQATVRAVDAITALVSAHV